MTHEEATNRIACILAIDTLDAISHAAKHLFPPTFEEGKEITIRLNRETAQALNIEAQYNRSLYQMKQ